MKSKNKNKIKAKFLIASCLIISGIIGFIGISPAINAQGSDRGIIISPPIIEATIPKGQKSGYSIRVENDNPSNAVKLKTYLNKVSIDDQDNPVLEPIETGDNLNSIIQLGATELTLAPKEVKNLDFVISQPSNTLAGNLVAIIFEPITADTVSNGIDIKQRLSTLVFAQTPQQENEQIPKFQIIKTTSDLQIIDPFLDNYNLNYQVYNPTPRFVKVDPLVNQAPNQQVIGRKTILPFGVRTLNITNLSPVQLPKWLQSLINPRLDTAKITTNQDLTNGTVFGEKTWNLNNDQDQVSQVKVFFVPWKSTLFIIILITILISLYYLALWFLAKIKINGRELVSTPNVSKRLPVIICFGISFICLTAVITTQSLIPRVELNQPKIDTEITQKNTSEKEISLNDNFSIDPLIVNRGFKVEIQPKTITINNTNCQTPKLPERVNGCYLDLDLTKIITPKNTIATSLILSQVASSDIQVTAKSKDGQDLNLQITSQKRDDLEMVVIDIANPNIDLSKPIEIRFWQQSKNQAIVLDNIIAIYK